MIDAVFSNVDLLVTPTTAMSPPTIEEALRLGIELEMIRNTAPFNVYGLPTISIPCGFTSSGRLSVCRSAGPASAKRGARARARLRASNCLAHEAA